MEYKAIPYTLVLYRNTALRDQDNELLYKAV